MTEWHARPDWPMDWELQLRAALMDAVRRLPQGHRWPEADVEAFALRLLAASNCGRDEELPRNRPAGQAATERELERLHELAGKLADHIASLHGPAVEALMCDYGEPFTMATLLRELQDGARIAFSEARGGQAGGAGSKAEAARVTEAAAAVFVAVNGFTPSFTSDTATGAVRGHWPDFVGATFAALRIEASVSAQVRALKKRENAAETGQ